MSAELNRRTAAMGLFVGCAGLGAGLGAGSAFAQAPAVAFPARPVRLIIGYSAGSPPDAITRLLADALSREWGQQVIVDNKPGASGIVAINELRKAKPDGYDLLLGDVGNLAINPTVYRKLPYDPERDLVPVVDVLWTPWVFFTARNGPIKSLRDLIDKAKAHPGSIRYVSGGVGSPTYMTGELFKLRAGIDMLEVPFKETSQIQPAVINQEVELYITSIGASRNVADKLLALGVASRERHPTAPDVPTIAEAGGPANFEVIAWAALTAPAGVPRGVLEKVRADVAKAAQTPEVKQRAAAFGMTLSQGHDSEYLKRFVRAEIDKYAAVVKATGVQKE